MGTAGLRAGAAENEKPMPGESSPTTSGSMPLTLSYYEPKSAVYGSNSLCKMPPLFPLPRGCASPDVKTS